MTLLNTPSPSASDSAIVKDGTDQGFMADVIEASKDTPVVVDFWAPWCEPCKQLAPALESAVRLAKGKVKLVKINIDEHPGVAGHLGVRSIPAVFAFAKGRPVDAFQGNQPPSQLKIFVERLTQIAGGGAGDEIGQMIALGQESLKAGDIGGAAQAFASVLQVEPENLKAIAGMARAYLAGGDAAGARDVLEMAGKEGAKDAEIQGVRAALELAGDGEGVDDLKALEQQLLSHPEDHQARFDLSRALAARGDLDGAIEQLMIILRANRAWNEEAAHKQLLKIFEAAGAGSDVVKRGRRQLSALLFS